MKYNKIVGVLYWIYYEAHSPIWCTIVYRETLPLVDFTIENFGVSGASATVKSLI